MPNVLSPRDLVSRPDNMDETVTHKRKLIFLLFSVSFCVLYYIRNGFHFILILGYTASFDYDIILVFYILNTTKANVRVSF